MADAAEEVAGLPDGPIRLKWPNDLVVESTAGAIGPRRAVRKLAGVLGETDGLGTADVRGVSIGLGINADWPARGLPARAGRAMTSLREASGGRPIDRDRAARRFLVRLEPRASALCAPAISTSPTGASAS